MLKPVETLFVVDAMQGQDAVNTAKAFNDALPLTGVVLTKIDGDSRGGAALVVRHITGAPIKFVGHQREDRRPGGVRRRAPWPAASWAWATSWRWSSRSRPAWTWLPPRSWRPRSSAGDGFDLNDFLGQLQQMKKMGGLSSLLDKLPAQMSRQGRPGRHGPGRERQSRRKEGIIQSMTPLERRKPELHQGHPQAPHRRRFRRARFRRSTACSTSSSRCRA